MNIPAFDVQAWSELLTGQKEMKFSFLATRILVGRLVLNYKIEPTEAKKKACIEELVEFFQRNSSIPQVQKDLNTIFGGTLS